MWRRLKPISSRRAAQFAEGEQGGVTVEFVLWLPMMVALLALVMDVSLMFYHQSSAVRVVQDANRAFSLGRVATTEELQTMVTGALQSVSPNVQVSATMTNGIVETEAAMPASDLDAIGWFSALSNVTIAVRAQHLVE